MTTINIKAQTEDISQIEAIKAFMKALKIRFELTNEPNYNPEFVAKIEQGDKDKAENKGRKITVPELEELWK